MTRDELQSQQLMSVTDKLSAAILNTHPDPAVAESASLIQQHMEAGKWFFVAVRPDGYVIWETLGDKDPLIIASASVTVADPPIGENVFTILLRAAPQYQNTARQLLQDSPRKQECWFFREVTPRGIHVWEYRSHRRLEAGRVRSTKNIRP